MSTTIQLWQAPFSAQLERHYVRGLAKITLHCLKSTLTYQAIMLANVRAGRRSRMRWAVAKLA